MRHETAKEELIAACKLALERLKPGPIMKDYAGHVAYAALGQAIYRAEHEQEG
jgi:hypothetical protein